MVAQTDQSSSGIQQPLILDSLAPGSILDVETKSRHYRIECLGGNSVRISGHPELCPNPTPAFLQGALDHEGMLDAGTIGLGKRLMFILNDKRPVTTSKILKVHVDKSPTSIH
jgi:hypothetical protein